EEQEQGRVVVEWPEGETLRLSRRLSFSRLSLAITGHRDWFEVSGELRVDDELALSMKQLLELLRATPGRFIPLGDGQYLALTRELRRQLDDLAALSQGRGKEIRLHPLASFALEGLTSRVGSLKVDEAWRSRLERIRAVQDSCPNPPSTLQAELRDYQVDGFRWLSRMAAMGMGACLADDMGLGKTVQALALLLERGPQGPALVVAPTSVCLNWPAEVGRFAPSLNLRLYAGPQREKLVQDLGPMDVLVASYTLLQQDKKLLAGRKWHTIVLDEAQAIKNVVTKRAQAAMSLEGGFRLITTGTPIENHLGELWTLFNFINPGLLGSQQGFNERFAIPIARAQDQEARKRLKRLIAPFILRRTKAQVLDELPPRTEVALQVEMSPAEAAFYEILRQEALERLAELPEPSSERQFQILAEITRLRLAACHPRLVRSGLDLPSAKLELFAQVVAELVENRHKALIFSQFVSHLTLIRHRLDAMGISYRYLDGRTPAAIRRREIDAFQAGEGDLFLISLKAGGLGLNLTAADYVLHMDPWWNPAVEDQASDRAHRIGQQRPVTVYRLITRHTIEEKIVQLHQDKRDLANSLLDGGDMSGKISAEELLRLIREG
ncbi:MAG: DEAD/DEAH box helicase, partial [Thermodesulfobacteriota bacterium]